MGIAVSLHAPDCKTSSSSIGSSGTGLAQGSGIAYSDASLLVNKQLPPQQSISGLVV